MNCFLFSEGNLNFGIKTLEEIKSQKMKEKNKRHGGELIFPTFLSCSRQVMVPGSCLRDRLPFLAGGIKQPDSQPAGILNGSSKGNQRQISHLSYLHALLAVFWTVTNNLKFFVLCDSFLCWVNFLMFWLL